LRVALICPQCEKPIWPSDETTLGQSVVKDEDGEVDEVLSQPIPFHTACFPAWKARMEQD
jgi:hypothetical protein